MKKIYVSFLIITLFISCSKKQEPEPEITNSITKVVFTKADNPHLIEDVEGIISNNEILVPLYGVDKSNLKARITYDSNNIDYNGEARDFTTKPTIKLTSNDGTSKIYTVRLEYKDVYFAGYEQDPLTTRTVAVYWKNNNKVVLTPNSNLSVSENATSIFVKGNDVYVTGTSLNMNTGYSTAVYWKNGVQFKLPSDNVVIAQAKRIIFSENDIYILGVIAYPAVTTLNGTNIYWKNGIKHELSDSNDSEITSLFVYNNDIYLTGKTRHSVTESYKAAYWKNGTKTELTNDIYNANANALAIVNNDVYVVGKYGDYAAYWKNGVRTDFERGEATAVRAINNDVLIIGNIDDLNAKHAFFWKNGLKTELSFKAKVFDIIEGNGPNIIGYEINDGVKKYLTWLNNIPVTISKVSQNNEYNSGQIFIK